jgi:hypothetical protein
MSQPIVLCVGELTTQFHTHLRIDLCRVIRFEYAELKFMRSARRIAGVNCLTVNQLIAPHAGVREWPRDGTANATRVVPNDEFAQRREWHSCRLGIIPAASDDHYSIYAGPTR